MLFVLPPKCLMGTTALEKTGGGQSLLPRFSAPHQSFPERSNAQDFGDGGWGRGAMGDVTFFPRVAAVRRSQP